LLLSAAAVAGEPVAAAGRGTVGLGLDGALERLDEPRVDGGTVAGSGGLDTLFEALREPEGDAGRERLVDRIRGASVLADEDELPIAAGDPHLDVRGIELRVELECRFCEDVLDLPAHGRLDRDREEICRPCGRFVAECCDAHEVLPERLDVTIDLHGCTMTSS